MKHLWLWLLVFSAIFNYHDFMVVYGLLFIVDELKDIYHVSREESK